MTYVMTDLHGKYDKYKEMLELISFSDEDTMYINGDICDRGEESAKIYLDIMSRTEGASYEEYFCNWAKVWCQKAKPEYSQLLLKVDVHGPAILRANITPRNFPEWYDTFNVKKTDKMYIAPSKRIIIW